jgi:5-methylcytosine-specific restriction endonuclease McrA
MPIKPENRDRYPADWPEIREAILDRAQGKCERCLVPDRVTILRGAGFDEGTYMMPSGALHCADTGRYLGMARSYEYIGRSVEIVLTIAHLDHVPENSDPENLRAWCQKCHLDHDRPIHIEHGRQTRRAKKAMGDLFAADGGTA